MTLPPTAEPVGAADAGPGWGGPSQPAGPPGGTGQRLLLDTHVLLWWALDDARLSATARAAIADPGHACYFSAASAWEMAIKASLGRLQIEGGLDAFVRQQLSINRIQLLPVDLAHGLRVAQLPWLHRDPFDRLLLAQCLHEGLTLVSADATLRQYAVPLLW